MALEHCADIIVKLQEAEENNLDLRTSAYFASTFKSHFRLLEKAIQTNWRLHKAFHEAQG